MGSFENIRKLRKGALRLVCALSAKSILYYWVYRGIGKMFYEVLKKDKGKKELFENRVITESKLENSEVSLQDSGLFYYQTGCLTIKDYKDGVLKLGKPKKDAESALSLNSDNLCILIRVNFIKLLC